MARQFYGGRYGNGQYVRQRGHGKLMTYATGRAITPWRRYARPEDHRDSANTNYRLSSLILGVVKSERFEMRTKDSPRSACA
jgi:hypothetical protein